MLIMFARKPNIVRLKEVLESNICFEHHKNPQVYIYNDVVTLECCCTYFFNDCRKLALDINEVLEIENLVIKQWLKG